ncbi:MAG TPA: hypothetical protein VHE81_04665 [Lacipirellulaceae bacterium]|nr:hypothetical protein [Lacipirellulaceae bacterium]
MPYSISRVSYFNTTVRDQPGEAYRALQSLADLGINLLAFTATPIGPTSAQLTLFPEDSALLAAAAKNARLLLDGPYPALLVRGDDKLGALAHIHETLYAADVNVYASSGVTDGHGSFGYVVYVRPDQFEQACKTFGV